MAKYVVQELFPTLHVVGQHKPDGWEPESDHRDREEAKARAEALNSGKAKAGAIDE